MKKPCNNPCPDAAAAPSVGSITQLTVSTMRHGLEDFNGTYVKQEKHDALAAQNEALRDQIHDEIAANLALRERFGAKPDEDMPTFLERLGRDATRLAEATAIIADLVACRMNEGWRISAGKDAPMALNKVLPRAQAFLEAPPVL